MRMYAQTLEPVKMPGIGNLRWLGQCQVGQTLKQDLQSNSNFKTGQLNPRAIVHARTKAYVATVSALRIELPGLGEACWIMIGGAQQQAKLLAALEGDAVAQAHVLLRVAGEQVQGRTESTQLLYGAFASLRRVEPVVCTLMLKQGDDCIAELMHGGFMTGVE